MKDVISLSVAQIAEFVGGDVRGDKTEKISGASAFEDATANDITFAGSAKYLKNLDKTNAGAVLVPRQIEDKIPVKENLFKNLIFVGNPQIAFIKVLKLFHPPVRTSYCPDGISPNAQVGINLTYGEAISVAAFVVIGENVTVGDRVIIHPGTVIGDNVTIGDDTQIYPNVTIREGCRIGKRVIIHAGTVVGSDGFGFAPDKEKKYHKIPHLGIVQIDDDVEIGASNTIDRATFGKTWIKKGVKTDNLVHIAHNVIVGEHSVLVAQVGISGSVTIGSHAILAGQAGVAGHLTLGDNITVGPQAGVAKSVPDGETVSGSPEMPHQLWLRVCRIIPRLPEIVKRLTELEKKVSVYLGKKDKSSHSGFDF